MNRFLKQEEERLQKQIAQQETFVQVTQLQLGDEGDRASQHIEHSHQQAVLNQLRQTLVQVQAARARLDAGTYGICDDCARPIPSERLQAIPYATFCVTCQSKRERKRTRLLH